MSLYADHKGVRASQPAVAVPVRCRDFKEQRRQVAALGACPHRLAFWPDGLSKFVLSKYVWHFMDV